MRWASLAVDAAFLLMLVAVPLAWSGAFIAEFTLAKFLALNAALVMAACAAAWRPESLAGGRSALDAPLIAGLLVAGLSSALSADPLTSLRGRYDSYAYGVWTLVLVASAAEFAARSARGREASRASWLVWPAALVGGYGIAQKLGFDPVFHFKNLPSGGRAVSSLGSPVDLGALLALAMPLSLDRLSAGMSFSAAIPALAIAAGIVATGSRGAMAGAAAGSAAYWLLTRRRDAPGRLPAVLALAMAAAAAAWALHRPNASASDIGRREVWKTAWAVFMENPWIGAGPDGFEDAFRRLRTEAFVTAIGSGHYQAYPHNDILQVLAGLGLLGAAAYAWLIAVLVTSARRALSSAASRPLAAALAAGLLALWLNCELNPVSLEVLVFAAAAAGLLVSLSAFAEASAPPLPRAALACVAALAALSLAGAVGMARADAVFKRGARAQAAGDFAAARLLFARARAAAPCELSYILAEVNAIGDWINATHVVDERLALLALAEADGAAAKSCHPRKALAPYIAGAAARMRADLGFKDQLAVAAREFDAALALDPRHEALQQARREVSRLQTKP